MDNDIGTNLQAAVPVSKGQFLRDFSFWKVYLDLSDDLALHHRDFNRGIEAHNSFYIWSNRYTKKTTSCDIRQVLDSAYLLEFSRYRGQKLLDFFAEGSF